MARVRQECFRIPLPFGSDLRQQQAAARPFFDHDTMAADLDVGRAGDRFERHQQRQLEIDVRQLVDGEGRKSRIEAACGRRAARDDAAERLVGIDVTDAAAKLTVLVNGDEGSAGTIRSETIGKIKVLGYKEAELINVE